MRREDLRLAGGFAYDVSRQAMSGMRVDCRVYADETLLQAMAEGETLTQLVNVATLPGVQQCVFGMPDMHEGYGFPVGGVAAMSYPDGVVSPGGVGFDINCGVRLLVTPLEFRDVKKRLEALVHEIAGRVPAGTGRSSWLTLTDRELMRVLEEGSAWLVHEKNLGLEADLVNTESGGCLPGAVAGRVSQRALERGRDQLGTMGSGNHFVELQEVEEVYEEDAARAMGLAPGLVAVLIHTGSRGLGHQVCTDYVRLMDQELPKHGITLPDRQLSCAPISSKAGHDYLAAMACAANFAWANRQMIGQAVRQAVCHLFTEVKPQHVRVVYDVAHNIAKIEEHGGRQVCVHRKGATRAFGPGHPELPEAYQAVGQPVFIPGSMGTASYVLAGLATSESRSWGSTCHGAGRNLSRTAARKKVSGGELRKELEGRGIVVRCLSSSGLAEEAPVAYKDVDRVAEVVEKAGLARRVARLRPLGVIKG